MKLRFALLSETARLPTRANPDDAGVDLHAAEAATVPAAGGRRSIGTGLAVEIPPGHAGLVLPRSGLAERHGITLSNSPGLVDSGYRGELRVLLLNTDPAASFELEVGNRIAQLVLIPFIEADAIEVSELQLSGSVRGGAGFGSSGR